MYKVFAYRLYPTKPQIERMELFRETCRRWYNACLAQRKQAYAEHGVRVTRQAQIRAVTVFRASDADAAQLPHHVLQDVVDRLERTFQAFFRRVAADQRAGYPRFKSSTRYHSFGYKQLGHGFKVDGRRLRLTGIGRVAVRWHRPLQGTVKTLQIKQSAGKWYAFFTCVVEPTCLARTGQEVGVDVGIASLLTLSTGQKIPNPAWYRDAQLRLRVLQRRVNRRTHGGQNRHKVIVQLRRQHIRIANQRKDALNKIVHALIQQYDRIALEQLRIQAMVKNRHLAKSILDAGWGYFRAHLMRKAAEAGRVVCLVDPRNTSRTCAACGARFEHLTLKDRWVHCPCGVARDRDHNAALNILDRAGQVRWASSSSLDGFAQVAASRD